VARINGGRLVARALKHEGVRYLFALSGGEIDPVFQGCTDEGIRVIDTRHEQAAVFAAEGWALVTGKPGVAAATAGPGVTNAVTGLWDALGKACPIVVFGGRTGVQNFELGAMQDMDSLQMARAITKWARAGYETKRIAEYVSMAFRQALSGQPGPAYLEFPIDVLSGEVEEEDVVMPTGYRTTARPQGDPELVGNAVDLILKAERPLVIGGMGLWWSQAAEELREFCELTGVPFSGLGAFLPADHPLSLNARVGTEKADVILVVGTRLDFRMAFGRPPLYSRDARWIQVDIEPTEIGRNRPIDIGIIGDARAVLRQMTEEARERCRGREELPWVRELREQVEAQRGLITALANSDSSPVHPARLCREIRDILDRDATIIIDGGEISGWGLGILRSYHPNHMLSVLPTGTLGVGQGYAIAARLARPDQQVLLLSGDGSFGLNAMEFDTMARHKLPVVSVISNDGGWGMIRRLQLGKGSDRVVGSELGFVRYDRVVEALGGYGEAVEKPEDVRPALERAFASGLPACINVRTAF